MRGIMLQQNRSHSVQIAPQNDFPGLKLSNPDRIQQAFGLLRLLLILVTTESEIHRK